MEPCAIAHEHEVTPGDNGVCPNDGKYCCAKCGATMCGFHAFISGEDMLCSVCYGVDGWERIPQCHLCNGLLIDDGKTHALGYCFDPVVGY